MGGPCTTTHWESPDCKVTVRGLLIEQAWQSTSFQYENAVCQQNDTGGTFPQSIMCAQTGMCQTHSHQSDAGCPAEAAQSAMSNQYQLG